MGTLEYICSQYCRCKATILERFIMPPLDHWCIAGDFNMLEDPIDRRGDSSITIHGHELAMSEQLVFSLQIVDA